MQLEISSLAAARKIKIQDPKLSFRGSDAMKSITASTNYIVNPSAWFIFSLSFSILIYILSTAIKSRILLFFVGFLYSIISIFFQLLNDISVRQFNSNSEYKASIIFMDTAYQCIQFTLLSQIYFNIINTNNFIRVGITVLVLFGFYYDLWLNYIKRSFSLLSSDFNYIFIFLILLHPIVGFRFIQNILIFAIAVFVLVKIILNTNDVLPGFFKSEMTRIRSLLTIYPLYLNIIVFVVPIFFGQFERNIFYYFSLILSFVYLDVRLCIQQIVTPSSPDKLNLDLLLPWFVTVLSVVVDDEHIYANYWIGLAALLLILIVGRIVYFVIQLIRSFKINLFKKEQ